jgi:hypothetical protein
MYFVLLFFPRVYAGEYKFQKQFKNNKNNKNNDTLVPYERKRLENI